MGCDEESLEGLRANPKGSIEQDDERDIKQESDCETVEANGVQCQAREESITSGQSGGCPSIKGGLYTSETWSVRT